MKKEKPCRRTLSEGPTIRIPYSVWYGTCTLIRNHETCQITVIYSQFFSAELWPSNPIPPPSSFTTRFNMFCARCLVRSLPTHLRPSHTRLLTTHPAVTSTSAAQPFSTPLTPSPASLGISSSEESTLQNQQEHVDENIGRRRKKSSVKAGMPLRGLEFVKGKDPPLAREDEEYPEWLWGLLEEKKKKGGNEDDKGEGDVFCM